ncbi:MAG: HAD family hydrolase [Eubacteriales bacterium]
MKYRGVLFDLDGTLLYTLGDLTSATNRVLGSLSFPPRSEKEIMGMIGDGFEPLIRRAVPAGAEIPDFPAASAEFRRFYLDHMTDTTRPYEGIVHLLGRLAASGCVAGVVSNKFDEASKTLVEKYFGKLIGYTVGVHGGNTRKPSPVMVFEAMEYFGLKKEETIYVGDSPSDLLTAGNAGIPFAAAAWGYRSREVLCAAGAENIFGSPRELEAYLFGGENGTE